MSQTTTNLIASIMDVQPRALILAQRSIENQDLSSSSPSTLFLSKKNDLSNFKNSLIPISTSNSTFNNKRIEEYISILPNTTSPILNFKERGRLSQIPNQNIQENKLL